MIFFDTYIKIEKRTPRQLSLESFIPIDQEQTISPTTTTTTSSSSTTSTTTNDVVENKQQSDTFNEATTVRSDKNDDVVKSSHSDVNDDVSRSGEQDEYSHELNFGLSNTSVATPEKNLMTPNAIKRLSPDSLRALETE